MKDEIYKLTVYLHSGVSFDVYVTEYSIKYSGDAIKSMDWTSAEKNPRLAFADISEIDAIVVHQV